MINFRPPTALRGALAAACCALPLALAIPAGPALAEPAALSAVPSAALVGKGRMTFLGFSIFDAELYAPGGSYSASDPFALRLTYLKSFRGKEIARSSVKEIRRQGGVSGGKLRDWEKQMRAIFPDVAKGDSITGVHTSDGKAVFYQGGSRLGTIGDPEFSDSFFRIWLGDKTRNPSLRNQLVGGGS